MVRAPGQHEGGNSVGHADSENFYKLSLGLLASLSARVGFTVSRVRWHFYLRRFQDFLSAAASSVALANLIYIRRVLVMIHAGNFVIKEKLRLSSATFSMPTFLTGHYTKNRMS